MSILDSQLAPVLFLLTGVVVLAAFFRKTLVRFILFILIQILFFVLFPHYLDKFVQIIHSIRNSLG